MKNQGSKKSVLINVHYIVDIDNNDIDEDYSIIDQLIDKAPYEIKTELNNKKYVLEWQGTTSLMLESGSLNCGRCTKCNCWTTDKEKPEPIDGLAYGATVDGKLLCAECLPSNHEWAF